MNDNFEDIGNRLPDLQSVLAQRIMSKKSESGGQGAFNEMGFDPYQAMLRKKLGEPNFSPTPEVQKWPEEDINKLNDYCKRMGIVGFNCGRMHPLAAMAMLQSQYGVDYTDVPLENRIPQGYEKIGEQSKNNPNYPYSQAINKKTILHG